MEIENKILSLNLSVDNLRKIYNDILESHKYYFEAKAIIKPVDFNYFFNWVCCFIYDNDDIFHYGIKSNHFKMHHDYQERLFHNPNWTIEHEKEFLKK